MGRTLFQIDCTKLPIVRVNHLITFPPVNFDSVYCYIQFATFCSFNFFIPPPPKISCKFAYVIGYQLKLYKRCCTVIQTPFKSFQKMSRSGCPRPFFLPASSVRHCSCNILDVPHHIVTITRASFTTGG